MDLVLLSLKKYHSKEIYTTFQLIMMLLINLTQQTLVGLADILQDVLKKKNYYAEDAVTTCLEDVMKT